MKTLLHLSDTHGPIPWDTLPTDFDILAHTGDWASEPFSSVRADIVCHQMDFFRYEARRLAAVLRGRPVVLNGGNHDLLSEAWIVQTLREAGVFAVAPGHQGTSVLDYTFYGMREVPWINGQFEGECAPEELRRVTRLLETRVSRDSIVLAHCPPMGALAGPRENKWGNRTLEHWLEVRDKHDPGPWLVLCGHIHEHGGETLRVGQSRVVNSARTHTLLELPDARRRIV